MLRISLQNQYETRFGSVYNMKGVIAQRKHVAEFKEKSKKTLQELKSIIKEWVINKNHPLTGWTEKQKTWLFCTIII